MGTEKAFFALIVSLLPATSVLQSESNFSTYDVVLWHQASVPFVYLWCFDESLPVTFDEVHTCYTVIA